MENVQNATEATLSLQKYFKRNAPIKAYTKCFITFRCGVCVPNLSSLNFKTTRGD